jgi:hypothetical protein
MDLNFRTCLLLIFIASDCYAQFKDDFNDGDFTQNPSWAGNTAKFNIKSGLLHLQAAALSESAYLSTTSEAAEHASWSMFIQMDFAPSSSNYIKVYLMADQPDLAAPLNGYYVKIGGPTRDISLYRQTGRVETRILDGVDDRVNLPFVKLNIKVTREAGIWTVLDDVGPTGNDFSEGSILEDTYRTSGYFGFFCVYTSTRADKFWFDDVLVVGVKGTEVVRPTYHWKDVIINELLADPSPRIGLPDVEFIEIYNRSVDTVSMENWQVTDGSSHAELSPALLPPGAYLILTSLAGVPGYSTLGFTMGVLDFSTINNGGESLWLIDPSGHTIDSIRFDLSWYRDADKAEGGWTLELIDPGNPCGEEDNWTASESPAGGTPGHRNTVYANKPDLTGPEWLEHFPVSPKEIQLVFSEKLETDLSSSHFSINPEISINEVRFMDAAHRTLLLSLADSMSSSITYTIQVEQLRDCNHNPIIPISKRMGRTQPADSMDIVINEILFNPRPGGVDFVEVFNASEHFVDVRDWTLATESNGIPKDPGKLTTHHRLFAPGEYMVYTTDPSSIQGQYPSTHTDSLFPASLPGYADDEGIVLLRDNNGNVVDRVSYEKKWHSPFLKSEEGVSLERISSKAASQSADNWASASSLAGFATPGYRNSQATTDSVSASANVWVAPEFFAPGDANNEWVRIHYQFNQAGWLVTVRVIDRQQRLIRTIAHAETIPQQGFFVWRGDREDGSKAGLGYYLVWCEAVHPDGGVRTFWSRIIVASRE